MNNLILITGATSGIGLEMVKQLSKMGNKLLISGRNTNKLSELKNEFPNINDIFPLDLSEQNAGLNLYNIIKDKGFKITGLINNAGFGLSGYNDSINYSDLINMINVNILNLTTLCKLFSEDFKSHKYGSILNVASVVGFFPTPSMASYAATKAYVRSYSFALREELKKFNVTVTVLSPGATSTAFFDVAGTDNLNFGKNMRKGAMTASKVAHIGIKAMFKGKKEVVPGILNKLIVLIANRISKAILSKFFNKLLG